MSTISFFLKTFILSTIVCSMNTRDGGNNSYDELTENFGNASFDVSANRKFFKPFVWGAFTYSGTTTAYDMLTCCLSFETWKDVPENRNCNQASRSAAKLAALAVTSVYGSRNGGGKKDSIHSHGDSWASAFSDAVKASNLSEFIYLHHELSGEQHPAHVIVFNAIDGYYANVSMSKGSNENGVISVRGLSSENLLSKHQTGMFPLCGGSIDVDYCRNLKYHMTGSSSGAIDLSEAVANYFMPDGFSQEGFSGFTADYFKTYICTSNKSECDWYASWRMHFSPSYSSTPQKWQSCDTGY